MKQMKTIAAVSLLLYAALTAACAMPVCNASSCIAAGAPATAFIASDSNADPDSNLSGGRTKHSRIETYVTSDDEGNTLVIRIRIPGAIGTAVIITVTAVIAAAVIMLLRRRRAAKRQPTDTATAEQPASSATVPASTQELPAVHPDTAGTDTAAAKSADLSAEDMGTASAANKAATTGEKMQTAPTPAVADSNSDANGNSNGSNTDTADTVRNENRSATNAGAGTGTYVSGNDRHMLRKLDEFIAEHISEVDLTVNDMATAVYMSRSNLFRRLKTIYGITPNEYLRNKRLLYAAELLRQNQYTISDICFMVGFNSPSYFASCFKKYFGTLPNKYIREE